MRVQKGRTGNPGRFIEQTVPIGEFCRESFKVPCGKHHVDRCEQGQVIEGCQPLAPKSPRAHTDEPNDVEVKGCEGGRELGNEGEKEVPSAFVPFWTVAFGKLVIRV